MADVFKVVYQDIALQRHINYWEAGGWADAIIMAFSRKPADMKLIYIECHSDKVDPEFTKTDFKTFLDDLVKEKRKDEKKNISFGDVGSWNAVTRRMQPTDYRYDV